MENKKVISGKVIANKMAKTISVEIFRLRKHGKYGKFFKRSTVLKAHDEKGLASVGDMVSIRECRPLSKTKRWILVAVNEAAKG